MAVDSLRETRHINRIRAQDLSALWTAQSYRPDITSALAAVRRLPSWLPLGSMCSEPIAQGRTPDYATENGGYPCLKTKHVNGLIVDDSDPDWVTLECASSLAKFKVQQSTVLMNRSGAGSVGRCSVYLGTSAPLTNEHVLHIRVGAPHDACFVVSYLSSWWGERAIEQGVTGSTGQLNLANEHVARVPVPALAPDAQRYIGDKVRQAERLRERARILERESTTFFELVEWTQPRAGQRRAYVAGRHIMRSERLDAPFYDPGHEALEDVLQSRGARRLREIATLVEDRWSRLGQEFAYFEIGELDVASGVLSPSRLQVSAAPSRAQIRVEPWDVLVSTVRPNRKNVGLVPAADDSLPLVASTGFAPLRFSTPERAVFFHAFLRSDAATQQLMRWNSGATYPAIESDVALRVLAPSFDDDLVHRKGARWIQKFRALDASRRLTSASTRLVEELIEGHISESDLVAAQKALERGDRGADRVILQGLRQSNALEAKPLITDLDGLYALLDEPEGGTN